MMKSFFNQGIFFVLILLSGCKEPTAEVVQAEEPQQSAQTKKVITAPIAEKESVRTFEAKRGANHYEIKIQRSPDKDAPIVKDILETPFYDNIVHVIVKKNGAPFFERTFSKNDFDALLSNEDRKHGTLAGMCYFEEAGSVNELVFVAQVCMPGMDGGTHARVMLSLVNKTLQIKLDDMPDLQIDQQLFEDIEGV